METQVLQGVDFAICGSQACSGVWRKKGYRGPEAIIPQFGVDPELFPWREPLLDPQRRFTIGYIGRLVPEKGVDLLLKAVSSLEEDVSVIIIGAGPQRGSLEQLAAQSGIEERVEFIPWIASSELPGQLRRMDALVLPSRTQSNWQEQFGRVLLEAMASGVPVVGSTSGEIPNVIGDAGLVFTEGDTEALAALLCKLAADPELYYRLAERGRARVLAHYTQEQVAAATVRVYRKMMHYRHTTLRETP